MDGRVSLYKWLVYLEGNEELYGNFYVLNRIFCFKGMILMKFDHYYFISLVM